MISVILSFHQPRLKINSLTFYKIIFTLKFFQKAFFHFNEGARPLGHEQAQRACPPFIEKIRFESGFKFKVCFAKIQGIYLESGLVEVQNGSYSKEAEKFALVQL